MNRKEFLKTISAGTLGLGLMPSMVLGNDSLLLDTKLKAKKITILHTNDQHSRIEPFEATNAKNPNQGGFARRASLVQRIREQEKAVLLLDAGDIFQGTPYFNFYGGEVEFKLMSMMGYDAATMGNHDFDNGLEGFKKVLPHAQFPFICSNYDFKNTIVEGLTHPYKIFNKNGIRVGILGVGIQLEGLVGKKQYQETQYLDPIEMAQHYADFLRKEKKCDLVICLSHLGFDYRNNPKKISDKVLASATQGIDLIIGGHTHTFLKEPVMLTNKAGKTVLVNQVGWAGLYLGRIDFYLDKNHQVSSFAWNTQVIDNNIIV